MFGQTARGRFARLNADGALDATFANGLAGANHRVFTITLRPDGHALIGGEFGT